MRYVLLAVFIGLTLLISSCAKSEKAAETSVNQAVEQSEELTEAERLALENPAGNYGNDLSLTEAMTIEDILGNAESIEGQRVQVVATIKESCPKRGCWVNLEQDGKEMKVKVEDGFIVFPKSSVGKTGIFEGIVERMEMDLEQTRKHFAHEAEETGREFDPESITEPMTMWRIKGDAAKIQ